MIFEFTSSFSFGFSFCIISGSDAASDNTKGDSSLIAALVA